MNLSESPFKAQENHPAQLLCKRRKGTNTPKQPLLKTKFSMRLTSSKKLLRAHHHFQKSYLPPECLYRSPPKAHKQGSQRPRSSTQTLPLSSNHRGHLLKNRLSVKKAHVTPERIVSPPKDHSTTSLMKMSPLPYVPSLMETSPRQGQHSPSHPKRLALHPLSPRKHDPQPGRRPTPPL
jgi:hypothetical protein